MNIKRPETVEEARELVPRCRGGDTQAVIQLAEYVNRSKKSPEELGVEPKEYHRMIDEAFCFDGH